MTRVHLAPGDEAYAEDAQKFTDLLAGKTVRAVYPFPAKEAEEGLGWSDRPWVVEFTDGTTLFAQCDDEGNGAGALSVANDKQSELFYQIR